MNNREIAEEDLFELWIEDESTIEVESFPTKHDCHVTVYVTKKDDKYWKYSVESSYNNGIQIYGKIKAVEVEPVEVKAIEWRVIK